MEDNIKKIREACIAANPSIKDLVFGCNYVQDGKTYFVISAKTMSRGLRNQIDQLQTSYFSSIISTDGDCMFDGAVEHSDIEIIGRPIRLADVLLAIQKKKHNDETYLVNMYGIFMDTHFNFSMKNQWNLLKDNLEEQSPETISFVIELLSSN